MSRVHTTSEEECEQRTSKSSKKTTHVDIGMATEKLLLKNVHDDSRTENFKIEQPLVLGKDKM
jgi:hypothetical protein